MDKGLARLVPLVRMLEKLVDHSNRILERPFLEDLNRGIGGKKRPRPRKHCFGCLARFKEGN